MYCVDSGPDAALKDRAAALESAIRSAGTGNGGLFVCCTTPEGLLTDSDRSTGGLLLDPACMDKLVCVEGCSAAVLSTGLSLGLLSTLLEAAPTSVNDVCSVQTADGTSLDSDARENTPATQEGSLLSWSDVRERDNEVRRDEVESKLFCSLRNAFFI